MVPEKRRRGIPAPRSWNWHTAARCLDPAEASVVATSTAIPTTSTGTDPAAARAYCGSCLVRTECLAHALDERIDTGIWGGMTARQRRAVLRAGPGPRSWAALLGAATREE